MKPEVEVEPEVPFRKLEGEDALQVAQEAVVLGRAGPLAAEEGEAEVRVSAVPDHLHGETRHRLEILKQSPQYFGGRLESFWPRPPTREERPCCPQFTREHPWF